MTSKIYERIMQKQILVYIDKLLSPHLCEYRKEYTTQTALIFMLQNWILFIHKKKTFSGDLLMNLNKNFIQ